MTILQPGEFRTSDYRKAIPDWVKVAAAMKFAIDVYRMSNAFIKPCAEMARSLQYDHRPPLNARPYDSKASDFIPPQNDPEFIFAVEKAHHDEKTFGRKAGAEKTVTTRGSDVGEAARIRKISAASAVHRARMASKAGNYKAATLILAGARPPKPKRKWPTRAKTVNPNDPTDITSNSVEGLLTPRKKFKRRWPSRPFRKKEDHDAQADKKTG